MIEKIKEFWEKLPKTAKVFVYVAFSYILSEVAIELGTFDSNFIPRLLAGIINIALVFIEEAIPEVKKRLEKK